MPTTCPSPTFPGQFASKMGIVNQTNFTLLRSKNKLKYGIEKGKNFVK
jgi:hypothetical protein